MEVDKAKRKRRKKPKSKENKETTQRQTIKSSHKLSCILETKKFMINSLQREEISHEILD